MKFTSRYALVAALGLGIATASTMAPAFAAKKKDEKPAAPALKLSDAIRKPLSEADAATKKGDYAAAEASLATARGIAKTPDEVYMVGQMMLNLAVTTKDINKQSPALDLMLSSGYAIPDTEKAKLYPYQGHFAYDAKDYAKAEQAYLAAIAAGSTDQDVYARLADVQSRNGRPQEAVATLEKVIAANTAAGQPVPTEWYGRGADIASRAKLTPDFVRITSAWLKAYPVKQNWHDTLFIYRQMAALTGEPDLDLLRLARAAGVLPLSAQSNYIDYALAVYLKYPNEAVSVLNEGIAAKKLDPKTSKNTSEILALSEPKLAADKASLARATTSANAATATYKSVTTSADLFYGYADYKKAAELYTLALTKPGADANQANLRLGAALAQGGDKEGAKAALAKVTSGPYQVLANYWTVLVDHPAS